MDTKTCTSCGKEKPLTEFYRYNDKRQQARKTGRRWRADIRQTADGYRGTCKECHRAVRSRQRAARQEERRQAAERKGRGYTPMTDADELELEIRRRIRAVRTIEVVMASVWREWRRALPEPLRTLMDSEYRKSAFRARYQQDPDSERARVKRYKHANPDKVARWSDRRWRRIAKQTDGTIAAEQVQALYAEFSRCPYCNARMEEADKHLDHMDPVSRGGVHGLANLVVCCGPCNVSKGDKPFLAWLRQLSPSNRARARRVYTRKQGCPPEQVKAAGLLYIGE